jgi:hypothetical protein
MSPHTIISLILTACVLRIAFWFYTRKRNQRRLHTIEHYRLHPGIFRKVQHRYPHLNNADLALVEQALRDYFRMCQRAGRRSVAMPSQVVDVAWHEFILFTRAYEQFCQQALGRFLHHTPTEAMASPTLAQDGIKRAWRLACAINHQHPAFASHLPLIFAIDGQLNIADGFRYYPNCEQRDNSKDMGYCSSHIGCASGCAGEAFDSSLNSDNGGGSWFSGDGNNDSGSSDGGGCSGGGD